MATKTDKVHADLQLNIDAFNKDLKALENNGAWQEIQRILQSHYDTLLVALENGADNWTESQLRAASASLSAYRTALDLPRAIPARWEQEQEVNKYKENENESQ